jgi:hypothetical protein
MGGRHIRVLRAARLIDQGGAPDRPCSYLLHAGPHAFVREGPRTRAEEGCNTAPAGATQVLRAEAEQLNAHGADSEVWSKVGCILEQPLAVLAHPSGKPAPAVAVHRRAPDCHSQSPSL